MKTTTVRLRSKRWPQYVVACGDWHVGSKTCHTEGIHNCMRDCRAHLWVHHGDIIEAIRPGDKRFSIDEHGGITILESGLMAQDYLASAAARTPTAVRYADYGPTVIPAVVDGLRHGVHREGLAAWRLPP